MLLKHVDVLVTHILFSKMASKGPNVITSYSRLKNNFLPSNLRPEAYSMAGSVCTDTEIVGRPKLVEKMQK